MAFGHLSPFEYAELHGTFVIDSTTANGTNDRLLDCTSFRHKYKKQDLLELETGIGGAKAAFRDEKSESCIVDSDFYLPTESVLLPLLTMLHEREEAAPKKSKSFVRGLMLNENGLGEFDVWGDVLSLCGSSATLKRGIEDSIKNARKPIKSLLCHPDLGP